MWMYTPVVSSVLFYLITLIYLFIYCYLAASGLSCGTQDLHCVMWEISFWSMDCALAECRLQSRWAPAVAACRLPSGGTEAPAHVGSVAAVPRLSCSAAWGILVPQPGIEPVSPALQDRFFTTGPWEKFHLFYSKISSSFFLFSGENLLYFNYLTKCFIHFKFPNCFYGKFFITASVFVQG